MKKIMKIKKLRKAAGLSVQQLADLLGVYETEVHSWENEIYLPKARLLPAIAKVFGCTIDELYEQEVA